MTINNAEITWKNLNFQGLRDLLADTNNRFMVIFAYCGSQLFCLVLFFIARKMLMQERKGFYAAAAAMSMSRKF